MNKLKQYTNTKRFGHPVQIREREINASGVRSIIGIVPVVIYLVFTRMTLRESLQAIPVFGVVTSLQR